MEPIKFEDLDLARVVDQVLAGAELERSQAHAVLNCPDDRLGDLLAATLKVREAAFGRRVKVCILRNAQSGICPEDCGYCSQSKISRADIPVYKMQSVEELCEGARIAAPAARAATAWCAACEDPERARLSIWRRPASVSVRTSDPGTVSLAGSDEPGTGAASEAGGRRGSTITSIRAAFILKSAPRHLG